LKELIPAIRYIFLSTKADKKDVASRTRFWLKNTFTVESYIFDKKQKEVYQTKQPIKGC
jgi:hypothetical protein